MLREKHKVIYQSVKVKYLHKVQNYRAIRAAPCPYILLSWLCWARLVTLG